MKLTKFIGFFLLVFAVIYGVSLQKNAGAAPLILKNADKLKLQPGAIGHIDPGIFFIPDATPDATPQASPSADDDLTPIGYNFDANDSMFFRYDDKFTVKIAGGEPVEYNNNRPLRIVLTPKEGNPAIDLVVGFTLMAPGKFKIQLGSFDVTKYDASFQVVTDTSDPAPSSALTPETVVELTAHNMSTKKYTGENPPASGDAPEEEVFISNRKAVYLITQKAGTLLIHSRDIVDVDDVPTAEATPSPVPTPSPVVSNPNPPQPTNPGSNNGNNNGGSNPLPAAAGDLMGGNGGLKCSLDAVAGRSQNLWALLALIPMAFALKKKS